MKKIVLGVLAHVDAGKTTLTESLMFETKSIRKLGRVDHKDAFLDYNNQERNRGITIFSKQAVFSLNDTEFTLLDTPGHIDFSSEMERCLSVLDYAIVVISGLDGVQSHTKTIWNLLRRHQIPTLIFINKMDITHKTKEELMKDLIDNLDKKCVDFLDEEVVSLCDENLMESYLETGNLDKGKVAKLIFEEKMYPCIFGSALKLQNIDTLCDFLDTYCVMKSYPIEFGAKVFKVTYENSVKLVHMKITGGTIKAKEKIDDNNKIDQIRKYSGDKYELMTEASAGSVVVIKGCDTLYSGQGLGIEEDESGSLSSVMTYDIILEKGQDAYNVYRILSKLQDEDPNLNLSYHEGLDVIRVQLMGEIQIEVLKEEIKERFNLNVEFGHGRINYKESIKFPVEGVGHYEPLRHYSEVHVLIEPSNQMEFDNVCSLDMIDAHWQNSIMNSMMNSRYRGVLTGSPLDKVKITLIGAKAHLKHTQAYDFKEAVRRAVRQGLMKAESILLEPFVEYQIDIPSGYLSKIMFDLEQMNATVKVTETTNGFHIEGIAPVRLMQDYGNILVASTRGTGKLSMTLEDYHECKDSKEIIESFNYNPDADVRNPSGSVFCAHGAGYYVPWYEVEDTMHIPMLYEVEEVSKPKPIVHNKVKIDDAELKRVWNNTYKTSKQPYRQKETREMEEFVNIKESKPKCIIVDGYNVIHDWEELNELAKHDLSHARDRLVLYMGEYQAYRCDLLIVVFDAYRVKERAENMIKDNNIYVVYTKEKQTADTYIEKAVGKLAQDYLVTVVSSDGLVQLTSFTQHATRMSSRECFNDYSLMKRLIKQRMQKERVTFYNHSLKEIIKYLEQDDVEL